MHFLREDTKMQPAADDSGGGHVHGLSIRLEDGTWIPLDAVIAEGRRQRAREIRRVAGLAARWIGRTVRTFVSLVPAHGSRRKIPKAAPMAERLAARAEVATFRTDAVLGHAAGASAEGAAKKMRKGDGQPLAA
jgi:hypothetical protein